MRMRSFLIAFVLTALITGAVVYTINTGPEQHIENVAAKR
jgi:hypothetical protein